MKRVHVTIEPDGSATVYAEGYTGKSCRDATRDIEAALGHVIRDEAKSAMWIPEQQANRLKAGNGGRS